MKRYILIAALITVPMLGFPVQALAQQPLLLTASPVEVVGSVSQVSADRRSFNVANERFRLLPDAIVTDAGGLELTVGDILVGTRVGLVQQSGEVSHVIVYQGQDR